MTILEAQLLLKQEIVLFGHTLAESQMFHITINLSKLSIQRFELHETMHNGITGKIKWVQKKTLGLNGMMSLNSLQRRNCDFRVYNNLIICSFDSNPFYIFSKDLYQFPSVIHSFNTYLVNAYLSAKHCWSHQ